VTGHLIIKDITQQKHYIIGQFSNIRNFQGPFGTPLHFSQYLKNLGQILFYICVARHNIV
jgi:hypothetical protein